MIYEQRQIIKYVVADYISTNVAFALFNVLRYFKLDITQLGFESLYNFLKSPVVILDQIFFPLGMMGLYYLSGFYGRQFLRSRGEELSITALTALIGSLGVFFLVLINDLTLDRERDYSIFLMMWAIMFLVVYIPRLIITWRSNSRIARGEIGKNTLVLGHGSRVEDIRHQIANTPSVIGMRIVAVADCENNACKSLSAIGLPAYDIKNIEQACRENNIEQIVALPHPHGLNSMAQMVGRLVSLEIPVLIAADSLPPYLINASIINLTSEPYIDVMRSRMSPSTLHIKRATDIVVSLIALAIVGVPVLVLAAAVKLTSSGPAFYLQERMGLHRRRFNIIKLRTMQVDSEQTGPQLSDSDDERVTPLGRVLRKYHIDELPQFYNVLVGDMSLVGPRPERPHYVAQLLKLAPVYAMLHSVRPGITSLGMVKYGYASDVDQMLKRMNYDILYLQNISITTDLKILLYTINTVVAGKGV